MPTCGNCGKSIATSDVTCPHCGVLLAAYISPEGARSARTYEAPPPPPETEIPSIEMEIRPPSEQDVVTDPAQVTEEAVSTAPRPLFDTYLTVEEIARAAESDHDDDVVVVPEGKIATKPVEFEVPDYAKPPSDAEPIPLVDDDAAAEELIARGSDASATSEATGADDPPAGNEDWLNDQPPVQRTVSPAKPEPPNPKRTAVANPAADSQPVGTTDAYVRKLHHEAGYEPARATVSQPVSPARTQGKVGEKFLAAQYGPRNRRRQEDAAETRLAISQVYAFVLFILWFVLISAALAGGVSLTVTVFAVILTVGYKPVMKFLEENAR